MIELRFAGTPHLETLIAEVERLAGVVQAAPEGADGRDGDRLAAAAVATLQLDGSPLVAPPDPVLAALAENSGAHAGARPAPSRARPQADVAAAPDGAPHRRRGTWLDALAAADAGPDDSVAALEYAGAVAALRSDDLAEALLADPIAALAELHRRLTRGLVSRPAQGRPRRSEQAVHDASVGRVVFYAVPAAGVPRGLDQLAGWLGSAVAHEHPLVVSGVAHYVLLRLHPFEAANGRLARAAARLLLRAGGCDPAGAAAFEVELARDSIGYYEEVARTLRRRDLTIWLERWGEAVAAALRRAARDVGALAASPPPRARAFVAEWSAPRFTIADYRSATGTEMPAARDDLQALLDAGIVARVAGSRGLRYRVG